jgi:preprotein translocase subunit SecE
MKEKSTAKKPNIFVRIGKWFAKGFKEIVSELKKVTWPKGKEVLTNTGVVLVVVLFFLVAVGAFDSLLSFLLKLLTTGQV